MRLTFLISASSKFLCVNIPIKKIWQNILLFQSNQRVKLDKNVQHELLERIFFQKEHIQLSIIKKHFIKKSKKISEREKTAEDLSLNNK